MNIYCLTGFSPVPGDAWYVEAADAATAIQIVAKELFDLECEALSVERWEVIEVPRPFNLVLWTD